MPFKLLVVSVLIFLVFSIFLFAQPSQKPSDLANLLSGKSTDTQAVLSSIEEQDLPLALAVVKALEFKSLHREAKLSDETIEQFKNAVEKHLNDATTVSFQKTETCTIAVPAREITIEGIRLTVPAHFIAPLGLRIVDYGPKDEAGTILPDIWVSFVSDEKLVKVQMNLDGKTIKPSLADEKTLFYRLLPDSKSILAIGTHSVDVTLADSQNRKASVSWNFTVGVKAVSIEPFPKDAKVVGNFAVDIAKFFSQLNLDGGFDGSMRVLVRETGDGRRFTEYLLFKTGCSDTPFLRTQNLKVVQKFIGQRAEETAKLVLYPATSFAFSGDKLRFSFALIGTGAVTRVFWYFSEGDQSTTSEEAVVEKALGQHSMRVSCRVNIAVTPEEGPPFEYYIDQTKTITPIIPTTTILPDRGATFTEGTTGNISISGSRFWGGRELVEGSVYEHGYNGRLTVKISRWKKIGGNVTPAIVNPIASETELLFSSPGYAELVHELSLAYDIGEEHYEKKFAPETETSGLFGVFSVKGTTETVQIPQGILYLTARKIKIKTINVTVNGEKRQITKPADLEFNPPWVLAQSKLFPASNPITLDQVAPSFWYNDDESLDPGENSFDWRVIYEFQTPDTEFIEFRGFLKFNSTPSSAGEYIFQVTEALGIRAFPKLAPELLKVEISPSAPPDMYEGQQALFTSKLTPIDGFGTGSFDESGGNLDLLDGYEAVSVDWLSWYDQVAKEKRKKSADVEWSYLFDPLQGTGTYTIRSEALLTVREKETKSSAQVGGSGDVQILVKPGLRINSPINTFAYPENIEIDVTTTLDSNIEEWNKIRWTLNGTTWEPETGAPPHKLFLAKAGLQTLKAEYTSHENLELSHEVKFDVKPVSVVISPTRLVTLAKTVPLELIVTAAGQPIEEPNSPVQWQGGFLEAQVSSVEWAGISKPKDNAGLENAEESPFKPSVSFSSDAAFTALATVTFQIRVSDSQKAKAAGFMKDLLKKDEEFPTWSFVLPAARADLWGLKSLDWTKLDGQFPDEAIAETYRTFAVKKGSFWGSYEWTSDSGITPEIRLKPALESTGVPDAVCKALKFSWLGPDNQTGGEAYFAPKFPDAQNAEIRLSTGLNFDSKWVIPFEKQKTYGVNVWALEKFIDATVEPNIFAMPVDSTKNLYCVVKQKPSLKQPVRQEFLSLLNGAYNLFLDKNVIWTETLQSSAHRQPASSTFSNPYSFAPKKPGYYLITALANLRIKETGDHSIAQETTHKESAQAYAKVGSLIAYPGEDYVLPTDRELVFLANPEFVQPPNSLKWFIDDKEIGIGASVTAVLPPGDRTLTAVLEGVPAFRQSRAIKGVKIQLVPNPESWVMQWEQPKVTTEFSLKVKADEVYLSETPVQIGKSLLTVATSSLMFQADPKGKVQVSSFEHGFASCTFLAPARFEAGASHTVDIVQSDKKKESYDFATSATETVLLGCIYAKAEYSFAYEPTHAVIGMTRVYHVGSVTLFLSASAPVIIDKQIPQDFDVEIIAPFTQERNGVSLTKFDHVYGSDETRRTQQGLSENPVKFENDKPKMAWWVPKIFFNNAQEFELASTTRTIKPQMLNELINVAVIASPTSISIGNNFELNFFFGRKGVASLTEQHSLKLFNNELIVTRQEVNWLNWGSPLSIGHGPKVTWVPPTIGSYRISASTSFEVGAPEDGSASASESLTASETLLHVTGGISSWGLTLAPDHLDKLGYADYVSGIATHVWYYEKDRVVWGKDANRKVIPKPFAVAIASFVTLEAGMEGLLPKSRKAWINYDWKLASNSQSIGLTGSIPFDIPQINVPTPPQIGEYLLTLRLSGSTMEEEEANLSPVYAVWKIDGNYDNKYFDHCLNSSCNALNGMQTSASPKQLIDKFYDWWWATGSHELKYYENAENISGVILSKGGVCKGLGNYFYKALEAQGIPNEDELIPPRIRRAGYLLKAVRDPWHPRQDKRGRYWFDYSDNETPRERRTRQEDPYTPTTLEYWGAVVIEDPGLNRSEPVRIFPNPDSPHAYFKEPFHFQKNLKKLVPPTTASEALYVEYSNDNISTIDNLKCYLFAIGPGTTDGHAFIVFEAETGKKFLYDPSFGKDKYKAVELDNKFTVPPSPTEYIPRKVMVIEQKEEFPKFLKYLNDSVSFWRSNTYCVEPSGNVALKIIDARWDQVNFLELWINTYRSIEE